MKVLKVFGKIIAVILSIIYFFVLMCIMLILFSRNLLSGDYYAQILKNVDLNQIKITDIKGIFDEEDISIDMSVEDAIVKAFTDAGEEEKTARAIVENEEIREILGKYIGEFISYNFGGEAPVILKSDLETVLRNPDLTSIVGEPTNEDIDNIYSQILELFGKEILENGGVINGNSRRNNEVIRDY